MIRKYCKLSKFNEKTNAIPEQLIAFAVALVHPVTRPRKSLKLSRRITLNSDKN